MRSSAEHAHATALIARGMGDAAVARITGIPRTTIRDWRLGRCVQTRARADTCPRCAPPRLCALPHPEYAYILGMYLGDGDITTQARTSRLRISLDLRWPGVLSACAQTMQAVLPHNRVSVYRPDRGSRCVVVSVYSNHLHCLFPQHGPGPKHLRQIVLSGWQAQIAQEHAADLLRGMLHSDGCRFISQQCINGKRYEYPRYAFTNASADILGIFTDACDQLGIEWTRAGDRDVSIARRTSVAYVDEIGGAKS
jgi:hypothetical protein